MIDSTQIGGKLETPCFACLDGLVEDTDGQTHTPITIPITRIPAIFGRSHDDSDEDFFGLGSRKALSRKQCAIYYRDAQGGKLEWDKQNNELVYNEKGAIQAKLKTETENLPEQGFFVIECLGKNRILVNQERVEQGESMLLESGSSIRISSHTLYFLLPEDAPPKQIVIAPPSISKKTKKRSSLGSQGNTTASPNKKSKSSGLTGFSQELERMTTTELLQRFFDAIANHKWERRHQMIGTIVAYRAVRDAANCPVIQAEAKVAGVARSRIIQWIEESPRYSKWVEKILTKMEARSYQAAVTKSLIKAGYVRNGTSGRYVKWILPTDIKIATATAARTEDGQAVSEEEEEKQDEIGEEKEALDEDDNEERSIENQESAVDEEESSEEKDVPDKDEKQDDDAILGRSRDEEDEESSSDEELEQTLENTKSDEEGTVEKRNDDESI